jgi:hypothetical protein
VRGSDPAVFLDQRSHDQQQAGPRFSNRRGDLRSKTTAGSETRAEREETRAERESANAEADPSLPVFELALAVGIGSTMG